MPINWLDLFVILFLLAAVIRGLEVGFVRQFFSTLGFLVGGFAGVWLQSILVQYAKSPEAKSLLVLSVVLGLAFGFMTLGEYIGMRIKLRLRESYTVERIDTIFGSALAGITLLLAVWLGATVFRNLPFNAWQRQLASSRIVNTLEGTLPSAPGVLTNFGRLVDPNGFPHVFSALEPRLPSDLPLPNMGELNAAVEAARPAIVKVEGEGCGGIVVGSGFVAGPGLIVTNAHVVAGVKTPFVVDQNGQHRAVPIWFDPGMDLAVLRATTIKAVPLKLEPARAASGAPAAVAGYPGDGAFTAGPAAVLESFEAYGRDIYDRNESVRNIYSLRASVKQGNSGGPLLNKNGAVIGVIFASSVSYQDVGYALTGDEVAASLALAEQQNKEVGTGACSP